jgi:hypothetical protein
MSLRGIVEETSLGLRTVRTMVDQAMAATAPPLSVLSALTPGG